MEKPSQITSSVMMIRPVNFAYNAETAATNAFQVASKPEGAKTIQEKALQEFDNFVERLRIAGIEVIVFEDTPSPYTPDSIFPNNWVSFHEDGNVVLYPMQAHNRRLERKTEFITGLNFNYHFEIKSIIDLSYFEEEEKFLEGTGSMILDRQNKIAYACHSMRTHPEVLQFFCKLFNYQPLHFHAYDANDVPVYHTNVVMAVGEHIAIICSEAIKDPLEKQDVINSLKNTGKTVVEISLEQMKSFAGNMLQLKNKSDEKILVMSQQGYESLSKKQLEKITSLTSVLYADIMHIEKYGGGSARCMMAEIFNKKIKI